MTPASDSPGDAEALAAWQRARWHVIVSQFAPTALLGFTVWLGLQGLGEAGLALRIAAAGILLASGILGALVQFTAASEAVAAARILRGSPVSPVAAQIARWGTWFEVVRWVTPGIFAVIFIALMVEIFA